MRAGTSASAAKAAAAATEHQVQRGLFVDASIGFPLTRSEGCLRTECLVVPVPE